MGRMKQEWIAKTQGTVFTMYAVMEALGLPLSPEQAKFQRYLECRYPRIIRRKS